jgi:thiol:disulfide interchange protein DsbC
MFPSNSKRRGGIFSIILAVMSASPALAADQADAVRAAMHKLLPGIPVDSVQETPMQGLYEVTLGPQIYYMSGDGRYLLDGRLLDVERGEDLTEASRSKARLGTLQKVTDDQTVMFAPEDPEFTVTVFTDIDCGYCRKLHQNIDGYNDKGIGVRYMFFPRSGLNTPSYDKAVSVWCADDRNQALTDAKAGKPVESRTCDNPVAEQLEMGKALGVRGTPAIFLDDGQMVPGYVPPAKLSALLQSKHAQAQAQAQTR